jgi:hypothetical protein
MAGKKHYENVNAVNLNIIDVYCDGWCCNVYVTLM